MPRRLTARLIFLFVALAAIPSGAEQAYRSLALGRVILDAPGGWVATRERDGSWVIEDSTERWKLRVESEQVTPTRSAVRHVEQLGHALKERLLAEKGGTVELADFDVGEMILTHDYPGTDVLRLRAWHRVALGDTAIVIAHFTLIAPAELRAIHGLVERAIMSAELNPLAPPYRPEAADAR
jgi:hypothetical protein